MPTISVDPQDFQQLLGFELTVGQLEGHLDLVKGELKGEDEHGRWRIELNDTNRPDLWSAEGIARQIRSALGRRRDYPFFSGEPVGEIRVDASVAQVRPFAAAFVVRGLDVNERSLEQIIQTQEKLAENFGRRRKDVAIGVYNVDRIRFPIHYRAVEPDSHRYVPLGLEEELSLAAILEQHPKGQQYGWILEGQSRLPLLIDDAGMILSMPPIINSREVGEVHAGDSNLFVEATGPDPAALVLALNIMACDLADRGGRIERICTRLPFGSSLGHEIEVPRLIDCELEIPLSEFSRLLGVSVTAVEVNNVLERYGCEVRIDADRVRVQPPPTRADYLHPVDVVEDFAIARGYDTFEPQLPREFTTGRSAAISVLEDKARDVMIGLGYEELISNILCARPALRERMNLPPEQPLVEVANVMNENYSALRDAVLPSLLQAEARSATAAYPHRLFESGDVAVFDRQANCGSQTRMHLAGLVAHREANLSEIHADLDYLLVMLGLDWELSEQACPTFLPGRCARLRIDGREVGWLGEIHPEVLSRWEIGVPAAAFELALDALE
jgi:phenylalanyl-tRNA synthetase beta chain